MQDAQARKVQRRQSMLTTVKFGLTRGGCAHASVAACVKENLTDFGLRKLVHWLERGVLLLGFANESLRSRTNWFNRATRKEAAASAAQNSRTAVAKRDSRETRLRIRNLHDGCPSLICGNRWRNLLWPRNVEILRSQIRKDVSVCHNTDFIAV
jgi:hypothetical protein